MTWFRNHPERSPTLLLLVVGLAITGYGMGVFFAGGLPAGSFRGDFIVAIGLMTVTAGVWHSDPVAQMAGVSLTIYILVLLLVSSCTCTEGGW